MIEIFKSPYEEEFLKRIAPIQQEKIHQIYKQFPTIAAKVIVFGSSTSSACNRFSDVDLLIVVPDKSTCREQLSQFLLNLDFEIDVLYWSIDELKNNLEQGTMIIKNIIKSGVKIYDRDAIVS